MSVVKKILKMLIFNFTALFLSPKVSGDFNMLKVDLSTQTYIFLNIKNKAKILKYTIPKCF